MGKTARFFMGVAVASVAFCATASADIIVQQLPGQGGGPASDTLFRNQLNQIVWEQDADNIILSTPAMVRQISWWGFYGGSGTPATPPPATETMRIRFYGARTSDNLPDDNNILLEESFLDAPRTATGLFIAVGGRPNEYRYQVELTAPILLEAGTLYWLEVVQVGDVDSLFRWESGETGIVLPGLSFKHTFLPNWQAETGSLAFELSTVPEPNTFGFMTFGLLLKPRRRVRRGARARSGVPFEGA